MVVVSIEIVFIIFNLKLIKYNMKFLLQNNLINPLAIEVALSSVGNHPYETVGLIPFSKNTIEPIIGINYIPYGSNRLAEIASKRKFKGVHYDLNQLNYKTCIKNRDDMLNDDMILSLSNVLEYLTKEKDQSAYWFIRPSEDSKIFSGEVSKGYQIIEWIKNGLNADLLNSNLECVLAKPKSIKAEYRWFIVGEHIISGSLYRMNDRLYKERVIEKDEIKIAQNLANGWLPHSCCVMDVALVENELKVIEFNCINCSGFYDHDMKAVFDALWNYHC
jgi:hypothetical protein